jgi:hypothetical protein
MNNEHPGSFTESYKAKKRIEVEPQIILEDIPTESPADNEITDIDACLSEFISSEFDFKTLEKWDKIKTS